MIVRELRGKQTARLELDARVRRLAWIPTETAVPVG
jgi:hypothetical protein